MNISAEIAKAEKRLERLLKMSLAHLFVYTDSASSSSIGDKEAVENSDEGVDPSAPSTEQKSQRPVVRIMPFGLQSVVPKGLRRLSSRLGISNVFSLGIGPTKKYGPQNLAEGETCLYSGPNAQVYLDKNGNIIITPTGSGTVQVAGSTFALVKWDDGNPTGAGFVVALNTFIAALKAATTIANIVAAATAFQTAMTSASNFSSTKAKNG